MPFSNASSVVDTTPNDYAGNKNYGKPLSGGVVDTNVITIAYDAPHPTGATTYPGDDTTNTLDVGFVKGPQIAGAGVTDQFYQNGAAIPVDSGLTVADAAGVNITSATITIADAGSFVPGDVLSYTSQFGITGTYNTTTGVLALSGPATAAQYQTVLDSLTYSFTGDPTLAGTEHVRTVTYTVGDANSTSSAPAINTIDTFALPVVSVGAAPTPTVTSTSGSVVADSTISVTDFNGTTLAGATVVISAGAQTGDTLTDDGISTLAGGIVPGTANIHAVFNSATETLTLSGTDSVTNYIKALEEVQFNATNGHSGTRTLTWTVDDEAGGHINDSSPVTTTAIAAFGPNVTAGAAVSSTEGASTGTVTVATFTDTAITNATAGDFTATIDWGDGSQATGTVVAQGGGVFAVTGAHTYAEEGSFPIGVTVVDTNNISGSANDSATVADAPLTAGTATVTGGVEGTTGATLSATFTDANTGAPTSDFSGTITWGDGATQAFTSGAVSGSAGSYTVSGTHLYTEEGSYTATVTINDVGGSQTTETGSTTVADAPLTAGTVTVGGGVEGTTPATLSATFSDANTAAPTGDFSGTIDWGDGSGLTSFTSAAVSGSGGAFTVSGSHTYAEEGSYIPKVTINDVGGKSTTDTGSTTVADAPLTAGTVTASGGVEGTTAATLSATFSDANLNAPASDFSGTINWGDGTALASFTSGAVSGGGGSFTVSGSHTYAEEGTYIPKVTINDDGGSTAIDTGTTTVLDAPLTAGAIATVTGGVEGTTAATLSATFSDANTGAPTSDFSGTIDWGDGTSTNFTSADVSGSNGSFTVNGSHTYAEEGTFFATVAINDDGGSSATETGSTSVTDAPLTAGTIATATGGVEGTTAATLSATFTDANTGAPTSDFSGTINWGDGSGLTSFTSADVSGSGGSFTVSGSHIYAEEGSYTPTVTINDDGGSTATDSGTTTVADAALTAGIAAVSGGVEGTTAATLNASFSDANTGATASDYSGTIAWGDGTSTNFNFGSGAVSGGGGNFTVGGSHIYAEEGTYTSTVTINDDGGSQAIDTATTTVADAPLTAGILTVGGGVEGTTPATLSAAFTDANVFATSTDFSGTIDWGDGSPLTSFTSSDVSGSNGSFTVNGSHLYAEEGTFFATVAINDDGGSSATGKPARPRLRMRR